MGATTKFQKQCQVLRSRVLQIRRQVFRVARPSTRTSEMVELCERYGVSRKTGYKWVERYERDGPDGLRERSRAPTIARIGFRPTWRRRSAAGAGSHPSWGPEKILHWLKRRQPELEIPATSTAGDLLARRGLVKERRRPTPGSCPRRQNGPT